MSNVKLVFLVKIVISSVVQLDSKIPHVQFVRRELRIPAVYVEWTPTDNKFKTANSVDTEWSGTNAQIYPILMETN